MRNFKNFAAVDWSGQAVLRPKGLSVAHAAVGEGAPVLLSPTGGWSRPAILDWLNRLAADQMDVLIGLDLSPALPFVDEGAYFPGWTDSPLEAKSLWQLVDAVSAETDILSAALFLSHAEARRHFRHQNDCGDLFAGGAGRMRACEIGQKTMGLSPYSCLNLVGAAQVGKSSLTGMRVLHRLGGRIPVWPFDRLPSTGPVIVEIYTSIAARAAGIPKGRSKMRDAASLDAALAAIGSRPHAPLSRYDDHSTDAILTAAWLRTNAHRGDLWAPSAMTPEIAATEGWTFGVA